MRNLVILDRPEELAALFGEGFILTLANGQQITVKAEGEKIIMADGKLQLLMLHVEGSGETLAQAMGQISEVVNNRFNGTGERAKIEPAPPPADPGPPAEKLETAARRKLTARGGKGKYPCEHCDESFRSGAGRGSHVKAQHPDKFQPKHAAKVLHCDRAGCDYTTQKPGWLRNHVAGVHRSATTV